MLEAAVVDWMEHVGLAHPSGSVEVVCVTSRPAGGGEDTPDLMPEQRERVGAVFVERAPVPLERGDDCGIHRDPDGEGSLHGAMVDPSGRPAIRFVISPPTFETPDRAMLLEVGFVSGALYGGGFTGCAWVRSENAEAGWQREGCGAQYDI